MTLLSLSGTEEQAETTYLKRDAIIRALITRTPAEIATYVENNVTDLASAKEHLKIVTVVLSILAKKHIA